MADESKKVLDGGVFRVSHIKRRAYPDDAQLANALATLSLSADTIADAVASFSSDTPTANGTGYQTIVAKELESHLTRVLTDGAGLTIVSPKISPGEN
jgi:hypothetical protein